MRTIGWIFVLGSLFAGGPADAAGLAHNDNFIVLATDQAAADATLAKSEELRRMLAEQWLGRQLPLGVGPAIIHVEISETEDTALTWPIDHPERKYHKVWIAAPRERALGTTLGHEMTHAVLATAYPLKLPPWIEEGAASVQDDPGRKAIRRQLLADCRAKGTLPQLLPVFQAATISGGDQLSYAVAASVAEYLFACGHPATFVRFGAAGKELGWDEALKRFYGIASVQDLEVLWTAAQGNPGAGRAVGGASPRSAAPR